MTVIFQEQRSCWEHRFSITGKFAGITWWCIGALKPETVRVRHRKATTRIATANKTSHDVSAFQLFPDNDTFRATFTVSVNCFVGGETRLRNDHRRVSRVQWNTLKNGSDTWNDSRRRSTWRSGVVVIVGAVPKHLSFGGCCRHGCGGADGEEERWQVSESSI